MEDQVATVERNRTDLERQAAIRREKEELAKKYSMDKVTEQYIEAIYLVKSTSPKHALKATRRMLQQH